MTNQIPQVGQVVEHNEKLYQVTTVEWDPGEDEIIVSYRRKWTDGTFIQGQSVSLAVVDEAHTWSRGD